MFVAIVAVGVASAAAASAGNLTPQRLRCEYLSEPLGVDRTQPELSWIVVSEQRAQVQTAYQVLVASDPEKLAAGEGDLWDSGKAAGDRTYGVRYAGAALRSHQPCYWKVRSWDGEDQPGPWSEPALWTVGLLEPSDWTGQWIGSDAHRPVQPETPELGAAQWIWHAADPAEPPSERRYFLRDWQLPDDVALARATLTVAGDDHSTVYLNGQQVAFTQRFDLPMQVDVRPYLRAGVNEVRVAANNGAGPAGLLLLIDAETATGESLALTTDEAWRSTDDGGESWTALPAAAGEPVQVLAPAGSLPWEPLRLRSYASTAPAYLRRDFTPTKPVRRATAYLAALGWADLYLNGRLVNQDYFSSGWTDYRQRVYYRAYEVTDAVRAGDNALGIVLSDGWYSGRIGWNAIRDLYGSKPRVRAMVRVEYEDGTAETFATDESWSVVAGPTTLADILVGEEYDARGDAVNWSQAEVPSARRQPVDTGAEVDPDNQWHPGPPVVAVEEFAAKTITEPAPGVYVFDLGQNFAGVCRLRIRGQAGQEIQLRFGERLNDDGTLYTTNMRYARVVDRYTCRGEGEEVWTPRQTFHGFQYVELTGVDETPPLDAVTGIALSSDTPVVGEFECSDPMLNQLHNNIYWTQRANFIDVPTDCPQRDERLGWTGDAQVYVATACLNCDVQAFFRKWLVDLTDAQRADGQFPMVAPLAAAGDDGGPAWADAGVICPWAVYTAYGDKTLLAEQYPAMKRFVEFCRGRSKDGLLPPDGYHCFGDWLSINADTPKDVIYTAYYANAARIVSQAAMVLGKSDDQATYQQLYEDVKAAFNREYVGDDGEIRGDTQCCYVLALAYDLVEGEAAEQAQRRLVADIEQRGWHLSTGFIGTKDLMLVLSKIGRTDVALKLLHQESFPGWGFSIKHGATSIWERWDGWTPERGFQDVGMNSFAHYSFGAVYGWMVENLGGLRPWASTDPGIAYLVPQFDPLLDHCRVAYEGVHGRLESDWRREKGRVFVRCVVPANTTACFVLEGPQAVPLEKINVDGTPALESGLETQYAASEETLDGRAQTEINLPSGEYVIDLPDVR